MKEKFDEIFSATKYIKALEAIKKEVKDQVPSEDVCCTKTGFQVAVVGSAEGSEG